jgi:hypothetical protein
VLRVPEVPVVEVSVEVEPLMLEPDVVELEVLGAVVVVVVVVPLAGADSVPEPVAPEVLPLVPEVVPEVPEVVPELEVEVSVAVEPVVPVVVPVVVPEAVVPAPKFELLVVAGVPVPDWVVAPGDCDRLFGPWPVADVPVLPDEVPVPDDCACDTPSAATMEATAATMVKLFGSLLMRDLLLQGETEVAMGCPLQRSAVICRRAKSFGRGVRGKLRALVRRCMRGGPTGAACNRQHFRAPQTRG